MIKVGIIGGAGYTAGELIRLLLHHPEVELVFVNSGSNAGNRLTGVHEGLYGETEMLFTDTLPLDCTISPASALLTASTMSLDFLFLPARFAYASWLASSS